MRQRQLEVERGHEIPEGTVQVAWNQAALNESALSTSAHVRVTNLTRGRFQLLLFQTVSPNRNLRLLSTDIVCLHLQLFKISTSR